MRVDKEMFKSESVYFSDAWIAYTEQVTGLKAERVRYANPGKERPALEGVLYLNKKGRIELPFTCSYITLRFIPTETQKDCQIYQQWISVGQLFAKDIQERGWEGTLVMPPGFDDARVFQWLAIVTDIQYTFVTELPYKEERLDTSVRKNIRKAVKLGYTTERTKNMEQVFACLKKTAEYQKFNHPLTEEALTLCTSMIDDSNFFAYIGRSPEGTPVSAQVKLAMPGGVCIDWLAGTDREHINSGINQLLYSVSLADVADSNALYFDNCGANIEGVARAKSQWGFTLVPSVVIYRSPLMMHVKRTIKKNKKMYEFVYRLKNRR